MSLLAHSAQRCVPAQFYREHILAVNQHAKRHIAEALCFFAGTCKERAAIQKAVHDGSVYHDLGKTDPQNQTVLERPDSRAKLPLNHCDAGTAFLWGKKAVNGALLIYCHHAGLFSMSDEYQKLDGKMAFRDLEIAKDTNLRLEEYIEKHMETAGQHAPTADEISLKGLSLRIALSCLVNADHHDTALHYGQEADTASSPVHWKERLSALNAYVEKLKEGKQDARNKLRDEIYQACLRAPIEPPVKYCDAPVGSGKTTAVMAHLLKVAARKNLRHIFVVLPYTNIIKQSVDIYRKALVLPGENPEQIVAAHYHQADFSDFNSRHLSTLWRSPIIVTSSVQFFETIAGAKTSRLRKLHELPGSAVFVDESHSAMPLHLWSQQWTWLNELAEKWSSHFILASGSLVRFWDFPQFSEIKIEVPNLLKKDLQEKMNDFESQRVIYPERRPKPLNRQELLSLILSHPGPRLVILNTVQSAAVIAHELRQNGHDTLHLSTALAPVDREIIIARIHRKLEFQNQSDWTLVATSCVEAGIDFSFKTALRESSTVTSLLQTGGRANRQGKDQECSIIDFRVRDPLLNKHPAFDISRTILDQMFEEELMNQRPPAYLATESLKREFGKTDIINRADEIRKMETRQDYKEVARLCRIIDADTSIVVVTPSIIDRLTHREAVSSIELLKHSVQLWSNKISKLELVPFEHYPEIYSLGSYLYESDFLGYMKGILPLVYQNEEVLIV